MLTDLQCRKATGREKSHKITDSRGLHLFVTPAGYRSWRWKYRFGGKEKRLVFGSYPDVSLNAAREARDTAARLLKSGADPALERKLVAAAQEVERATTFEAIAREWHTQQKSSWTPVHTSDVLRCLERDVFPAIGSLPIAAVTSPMILQLVRAIEARPSI